MGDGQLGVSSDRDCMMHASGFSLFQGIPSEITSRAAEKGELKYITLDRDGIVELDRQMVFVAAGQLSLGVFDEEDFRARIAKQNAPTGGKGNEASLIKPEPLARISFKNLAIFMAGDVINSRALLPAASTSRKEQCVGLFASAPTTAFLMSERLVTELAGRSQDFSGRLQKAALAGLERLERLVDVKQEVLDFYVRHGISVSGPMVRVRQLDLCIDCKLCEKACTDRYGAQRLTLGGYQLGMLDFVFTCRTCTDQRCIDPCEYDSISYDTTKKEVVINEASCTGCSACAQSCPYEAITMVDVVNPASPGFEPGFFSRLEQDGSLKFGSGTPRVARARRIANKCDHCGSYRDQACVSACPTGALVELNAYELFNERSKEVKKIAAAGYNEPLPKLKNEILPTAPFTEGIGLRNAGIARVRRFRFAGILFWALGLGAFLLALVEVALRTWWPEYSWAYAQITADPEKAGLALEFLKEEVRYKDGTKLSMWTGYIGTVLMAVAAIYPMFRRFSAFRFLASNTMWFDFHMMSGTVGPMFIVIHCALAFEIWWAMLAFWCMVIVVVSGVLGRYIYTQVPDLLNGRELEELDHKRAISALASSHPGLYKMIHEESESHSRRADAVAVKPGFFHAFAWLILEDLKRPYRWLSRKKKFKKAGVAKALNKEFTHRTGRVLLANRRKVLASRAQQLLHSWKQVHVPFTILLVIFSAYHIYRDWRWVADSSY